MSKNLPLLNLHATAIAVAACARAGRVPLVIGGPGTAKTTLARAMAPVIARSLGYDPKDYPVIDCILSNRDAVDVGGFPVVIDGVAHLKLFGTLRQAAERPGLLLLDEFLTCSQSVQGPAMRLVLERFAGETPLHPDTRIVCVANPPEQAPGGIQLTAALVNRLVVLACQPEIQEISDYFTGAPNARLDGAIELPDTTTYNDRLTALKVTVGMLLLARPDLAKFEPPPAAINDGEPFASPRAWDICCGALASLPAVTSDDPVTRAITAGTLGPGASVSFLSMLRARDHLPTVPEVLRDPENAKLPDESAVIDTATGRQQIGKDVTFAAIPLLLEVGRVDTYAALLYASRLPTEIQAATAKTLAANVVTPSGGTPHRVKGQQALLKVIQRLNDIVVGRAA